MSNDYLLSLQFQLDTTVQMIKEADKDIQERHQLLNKMLLKKSRLEKEIQEARQADKSGGQE